ncbi:MAG TPA: hypothetical protein VEZ46_01920 [Mycobacteriales bacterium]|nr:hypothetical protein [Mycobacteriales bacterium]
MSGRIAAALVRPGGEGAPPGVDPDAFARSLAEDTYEVLADLAECSAGVVACPPSYGGTATSLVWPGAPVLTVADGATDVVTGGAVRALAGLGFDEVAVVAGDTPDLPGLLVGKLFSALTGAEVAACPAAGGGLVAIAVRVPVPGWLAAAEAGLDTADAAERLSRAAPRPAQLAVVSGWHRLRTPADVASLDPGLEGWETTRALLSR